MIAAPWLNFAIAVGVGLMIGLERQRSKGVGSARRPAGIRTFALAALMGAVAQHLGGVPLLAVATASVVALAALSYFRGHKDDPGVTTEIALIATPLLGGLAMSDKVRAWLERHPRWTFHFTPTSSSWLNPVEGFFAILTRRRLKNGVFRSVVDLQAEINRFINEHNKAPKPFIWRADPDKIIAARNRGFQALESIH